MRWVPGAAFTADGRLKEAIVEGGDRRGRRQSARAVSAAAIIMIAVFSGRLLDDAALIKSIGLGLASAVSSTPSWCG
ncbi:hypothetical protein [Streptomyces herbicida]|uniref:hypothetical protein n=1 Tax=Streptomyces herbicida TaxID=3065675 RepID=UPI0038CD22E5